MDVSKLENIINDAWENRDTISTDTKGEVRKSVEEALNGLDSGLFRVAEPIGNHQWKVNQWLKKYEKSTDLDPFFSILQISFHVALFIFYRYCF